MLTFYDKWNNFDDWAITVNGKITIIYYSIIIIMIIIVVSLSLIDIIEFVNNIKGKNEKEKEKDKSKKIN